MRGSHIGDYGMYLPLTCDGMYERVTIIYGIGAATFTAVVLTRCNGG
jgi:hypothetical protein